MNRRKKLLRAAFAGIIATIPLTLLGYAAPLMGLPRLSPPEMLAAFMGAPLAVGWIVHFMIGGVLAVIYSRLVDRFGYAGLVSGIAYGFLPWTVAQAVVMPLIGIPLFSGACGPAVGSLLGHLMYGAVVGLLYSLWTCTLCTPREHITGSPDEPFWDSAPS